MSWWFFVKVLLAWMYFWRPRLRTFAKNSTKPFWCASPCKSSATFAYTHTHLICIHIIHAAVDEFFYYALLGICPAIDHKFLLPLFLDLKIFFLRFFLWCKCRLFLVFPDFPDPFFFSVFLCLFESCSPYLYPPLIFFIRNFWSVYLFLRVE